MTFSREPRTFTKFIWVLTVGSAVGFGCARVEVQAPKEPIKMDISMRLDVYQHVVKDIDEIENIVSGKSATQHAWASFLVQTAYAGDLDPAVEAAAIRRRDRKTEVESLLSRGAVGENNQGFLAVRGSDASAGDVVNSENADRQAIYEGLAKKNGTSVGEIQKVYAERLRGSAPSGSPIQTPDGAWSVK